MASDELLTTISDATADSNPAAAVTESLIMKIPMVHKNPLPEIVITGEILYNRYLRYRLYQKKLTITILENCRFVCYFVFHYKYTHMLDIVKTLFFIWWP